MIGLFLLIVLWSFYIPPDFLWPIGFTLLWLWWRTGKER